MNGHEEQGDHHLCDHRRHPHAVHVARLDVKAGLLHLTPPDVHAEQREGTRNALLEHLAVAVIENLTRSYLACQARASLSARDDSSVHNVVEFRFNV